MYCKRRRSGVRFPDRKAKNRLCACHCIAGHEYVYGRAVTVESDHQPLETLSKKPLRDAPRRIQRMMLELQRYDVTITRDTMLVLADTHILSRAYLPETEEDLTLAERVFHTNTGQEMELVKQNRRLLEYRMSGYRKSLSTQLPIAVFHS